MENIKTNIALFESNLPELNFLNRGKVRDLYEVDGNLLIVATDRLSAFDVVLPTPIPQKGVMLTQMSLFWFERLKDIISNHLIAAQVDQYPEPCLKYKDQLTGRSMLVKKCAPLPVECIVRGYITGSGWKDYKKTGAISGISLPDGLVESERLPEPIFTPSTKAAAGEHDENISFDRMSELIGREMAEKVREVSLALYSAAADYALERGVIIADTKFEFGLADGELILIDEVLTPDSSRFWPAETYKPGQTQPSFDKQFVRDYLEYISWDKKPPGPKLPDSIVEKTVDRYKEALKRLAGK